MEQLANFAQSYLEMGVDEDDTSFVITDPAPFPTEGNFRLLVGSEICLVTAVSGDTFTVTRAQEGTTAAAHPIGAPVMLTLTAASLAQVIEDLGGEGPPGVGVPAGGTTGQVLGKASDADYDTIWQDAAEAVSGLIATVVGVACQGSAVTNTLQAPTFSAAVV